MKRRSHRILRTAVLAAVFVLLDSAAAPAQTTQEHVHRMASGVMPFDISRTVHVFKMSESGGIERVIAKDAADSGQIALIQEHLRHEAARFQRGDYSDPARLHGATMPGLREMQSGASRIRIAYVPLPSGAEIRFKTADLRLVTALHRWFGAQLSEHGADARAE